MRERPEAEADGVASVHACDTHLVEMRDGSQAVLLCLVDQGGHEIGVERA